MKKSVSSKAAKKHSAKGLLKSRLGMTYVELLTALGLLALIITSFTPMLLSSYQTLYDAGVKVQDVYDSKQEMEEGLARRDSAYKASVKLDMMVNSSLLYEQINVSGRKVISTFREGLETIFGQVRPRVEIVSPSTVYDDTTSHSIIIQTFGLDYNLVTFGAFNKNDDALNDGQVHIKIVAPEKAVGDASQIGTEDGFVYSNADYVLDVDRYTSKFVTEDIPATGLKIENTDDSGRLRLKINSTSTVSLDFTYSPIKVEVFYLNSRGEIRSVSDYLYIDPPTLIAAGETASNIDYYTTAGIEEIDLRETDEDAKNIQYQLKVEARAMRTSNSAYLNNAGQFNVPAVGAPSKVVAGQPNTEIRSIRWIDNDETQGLNPYYVMTGTNGSIYRMYTFMSDKNDIFSQAMGITINDTSTGFFSGAQKYIDKVYTTTAGRRVYPAFWGGDFSHIFEYTSGKKRVAYGGSVNYANDQAWITSATENGLKHAGLTGDPAYNVMSANAQFCYYYNGAGTAHKFNYKNARPISYVLTERGWPIRLAAVIGPANPDDDYFELFTAIWDIERTRTNIRTDDYYGDSSEVLAFHFKHQDDESQADNVYGQIRIKTLASYAINAQARDTLVDYFDGADDYENTSSMSKIVNVRSKETDNDIVDRTLGQSNDLNITDIIYIPSTDTTQGSTFYVGNVHAYANLAQTDKIASNAAVHYTKKTHKYTYYEWSDGFIGIGQGWKEKSESVDPIKDDRAGKTYGEGVAVPAGVDHTGQWYRNQANDLHTSITNGLKLSYPKGVITDYLVLSNPDGTATYICKHNDNDENRDAEWLGGYSGNINSPKSDDGDPVGRGYQFCFAHDYILANDANISYSNTQGLRSGQTAKSRAEFFLPNQGDYWDYLYLGDVSFTFGFASNRERVYTNITYDGQIEYTRSFERLYWRSHYGQDAYYVKEDGKDGLNFTTYKANQEAYTGTLELHEQNRAISDGNGGLVTKVDADKTNYLNHVDNDYYNVWFPGEMYNLTKIASKDGVTVAVGYAVAGSVYQYAHASDTSVTSTALGGIYNDGVVSAMIEGKDDAFVNLLYYKDNESFDNYSLYTKNSEKTDSSLNLGQYAAYGDIGYGTHSRDSIQFTAVDLLVENVKASETSQDYTVNYYAYYGDNKGRVFRSLVATGSGKSGAEGEMNALEAGAELVPYIKDVPTSVENRSVAPSQMVEITIGGKGLDYYFQNIGTIDATDTMIIITGERQSNQPEYIVVGVKDENNNWTYKAIKNGNFQDVINDATIVGGYYYIVGDGWLAGVSIETLKELATNTNISDDKRVITAASGEWYSGNKNELLYCYTSTDLYAIAGRDTQ